MHILGTLLAAGVCYLNPNLAVPEGGMHVWPRLSLSRQCHCSGADTSRHTAVRHVRSTVLYEHGLKTAFCLLAKSSCVTTQA